MKPWSLGALLASGFAFVIPACSDDASHRAQPESDAGAAGDDAAGGSSMLSEGGARPLTRVEAAALVPRRKVVTRG